MWSSRTASDARRRPTTSAVKGWPRRSPHGGASGASGSLSLRRSRPSTTLDRDGLVAVDVDDHRAARRRAPALPADDVGQEAGEVGKGPGRPRGPRGDFGVAARCRMILFRGPRVHHPQRGMSATVPGPAGVSTGCARSSSVNERSWTRRAAVTSRNSASTSSPVHGWR